MGTGAIPAQSLGVFEEERGRAIIRVKLQASGENFSFYLFLLLPGPVLLDPARCVSEPNLSRLTVKALHFICAALIAASVFHLPLPRHLRPVRSLPVPRRNRPTPCSNAQIAQRNAR
jgi:hypothetical protein